MEVTVGAGEHLNKAILVALWDGGNGHTVEIDVVPLMQRPRRECQAPSWFRRRRVAQAR